MFTGEVVVFQPNRNELIVVGNEFDRNLSIFSCLFSMKLSFSLLIGGSFVYDRYSSQF